MLYYTNEAIMKDQKFSVIRKLLIGSAMGVLISTSALAGGAPETSLSLEEYKAAIESFGVSPSQAQTTAQKTVDIIAENQRQLENGAVDNSALAGLSDDFLDGSPY